MADLGLDLYAFEPNQTQPEIPYEHLVVSEQSKIWGDSNAELGTNQQDFDLPPVPDDDMEDPLSSVPDDMTDPIPHLRLKYAEDQEFLNLSNISSLEKFFLCVSANASPRRVWICNQLPNLLKELPQTEAFEYVFPLTLRLCQDEEYSVKEALVQNLDQILIFYFQGISKIDPESLVQLLNCSVFSPSPNISAISKSSFLNFCREISNEVIEKDILPLLIELLLTHGEENSLNSDIYIEQDTLTVKGHIFNILRDLYGLFKQQTLIEVLLPALEAHGSHPSIEIRKEVLFGISELLDILPSTVVLLRIYPLFTALATDEVYEIRMKACDVFVKMAEQLISNGKLDETIFWMNTFLADNSQKVKTAAAGVLGQVLYYFQNLEVPKELLKKFFSLCKSSRADTRISCAFNFPAIVLLLKSDDWLLAKPSYFHLINDKEIGVLHTLASSIHELAKILTPIQTQQDLLPVFYKSLTSPYIEVQKATLNIAGDFLRCIESSERIHILEPLLLCYRSFLLNPNPARDWRQKESLLRQLGIILNIFSPWESMTHILPLLLEVARSKNVIQVRTWAIESLPSFYKIISSDLCEDSGLLGGLFTQFDILLRSQSYRDRIVYVTICHKMLQDREQSLNFDTFFLPNLAALVVDPVMDVRLAVARLLNEIYKNEQSEIDDKVPDVRYMLTRDLLARFRPEDHTDIQSIVDSLSVQLDSLTLSS